MKRLVNLLQEKSLTIGTAESITGGLLASEIVSVPNASKIFLGGIVSYANIVKEELLNVDPLSIEKEGVVSERVVKEMAKGAYSLLKSDITVSLSGNAGPNILDDKPVGTVFSCIKIFDNYFVFEDALTGSRNDIRYEIVKITSKRITELINEKGD